MVIDRTVLCGGFPPPVATEKHRTIKLWLSGHWKNVHLRITDLSERAAANIPDELVDLTEIAAYVYSADQAATRGNDDEDVEHVGARWRRNFHFFISVRRPQLWSQKGITEVSLRHWNFSLRIATRLSSGPLLTMHP